MRTHGNRVRQRTLRAFRAALSAALAGSLSLAMAGPALAADEPEASMSRAAWQALEAKAQSDGVVPVIVTLDVAGILDNALSRTPSQRAGIARVETQLLDGFGDRQLRNLKLFDLAPIVAFHADEQDLEELEASELVTSVVEDREYALDVAVPAPSEDGTRPRAPQLVGPPAAGDGGTAGTSPNGNAGGQQLPQYWDWWRIGTDRAQNAGYTGTGQTVVVVDTGVDRYNPYLTGRVVNEACFATQVGSSGDCPNGSYYQYGVGSAAPCDFGKYGYNTPGCAHGTHVAHTAAGTYGIAQGANIVAIQVFHCCGTAPDGSRTPTYFESDLLYAMNYIESLRAAFHIAAINMSLGGALYSGYCDTSSTLTSWINYFRSKQIATVVASGNENSQTQLRTPACVSNAISVGNTTLDLFGFDAVFGNTDGGSNSNQYLDLLAPGTDICSAVPTRYDYDGSADGWQCGWIGTSMAAPHVAGTIAILKQKRPTATINAIQNALFASGYTVLDSRNNVSRILINVGNALSYI